MRQNATNRLYALYQETYGLRSDYLLSAVRSVIHIYGDYRTDSFPNMNAERDAMTRLTEEVKAIAWVLNNPNYAKQIAEQRLTELSGADKKLD